MHFLFKKLLFIFLMIWSLSNYSQTIEVTGKLIDETTKTPIEFATVQIEATNNQRLLSYGFSDEKGLFTIEAEHKNINISLVITYIGFETYKKIIPTNTTQINLGDIILHESAEALDAVVLTATPPILVKNDTMQFNAASFQTKEDAVAEDLLKKLPGVSIDSENGSVQVNGIDVTKILVNGEPFFSNNPKIAMKVISKDVIEKIEITNTKSDEEQFTGTESEDEAKTINIILKKKKNGNVFGNITGGGGSNNRYEANGVANRMLNKSMLTVLAFSNNINKNNFSYDEEEDNTLDKSKLIKAETNIGVNYSDKFINGDRINVDYTYSDSQTDKKYFVDSKNLLPNSVNFSKQNNSDIDQVKLHKANVKLNNNITKNFKVVTSAYLYYRDRNRQQQTDKKTTDDTNVLINSNNGNSNYTQQLQSLASTLSAVYRFPNLNSFINYRIQTKNYSSDINANNISKTQLFGSNPRDVLRNQHTDQVRHDNNISNSIKYNQRIGKYHSAEYEFTDSSENKQEQKNVSDIDVANKTSTINPLISFNQKIDIQKDEHKISYGYNTKAVKYNFKISHLTTKLKNNELNRKIGLTRTFKNFLINSRIRYQLKNGLNFNANYRTKSIVPKTSELLTITNNTNPLNITVGNPDLDRELEHLISLNIRFYNRKNKVYFFNRLSYSTVVDKIIDAKNVDSDLVTTKTYINNSSNNKYILNGSISKDYKKDPLFYNFKLKWYCSVGDDSHLINKVLFKSNYTVFSPSFYTEVNYNDIIEVSPYYKLILSNTKYNTDQIQNQSNVQHSIGLDIATFAPKRFTFFNQLQFNYNPKFEKGFGKQSLVWNITANYSIIPNKAKLKLTVFNILNQYNNTSRILNQSRNATSTFDVLQQYAMLSFRYNFKN